MSPTDPKLQALIVEIAEKTAAMTAQGERCNAALAVLREDLTAYQAKEEAVRQLREQAIGMFAREVLPADAPPLDQKAFTLSRFR